MIKPPQCYAQSIRPRARRSENKESNLILLIDNYDSFTYNLYQYLCELGADVSVVRNDQTSIEEIADMAPEKIVVWAALPRRNSIGRAQDSCDGDYRRA